MKERPQMDHGNEIAIASLLDITLMIVEAIDDAALTGRYQEEMVRLALQLEPAELREMRERAEETLKDFNAIVGRESSIGPIPFAGSEEARDANRRTHHWFTYDEEMICADCEHKIWHIGADYPCGGEVPRHETERNPKNV